MEQVMTALATLHQRLAVLEEHSHGPTALATLHQRLAVLEEHSHGPTALATLHERLAILEEHQMTHSHGPIRGAGQARARLYEDELRLELPALRDWRGFSLSIDDEDARYTTDSAAGVMSKRAAALYAPPRSALWDLYSAPGMDLVYAILTQTSARVVGVSRAETPDERARFERLRHNVDAATRVLAANGERAPTCALYEDNALDFCRHTTEPAPGVLWLSPPWMTSKGDMTRHGVGMYRTPEDVTAESLEILDVLQGRHMAPSVLVTMLPFDREQYAPFLPRYKGFGLAHVVEITKTQGARVVCQYFVYIFTRGDRRDPPKVTPYKYSL